jgi:hypothetical protein
MNIERTIITTAETGFGQFHFSIKKIFRFLNKVYITMVPRNAPKIPEVAYNIIPPKTTMIIRIIILRSFCEKTSLLLIIDFKIR